MDDRTALKNYDATMIKTYGVNYVEHWTDDDRETFEILARKARKVTDTRQRAINPDTSFLRVFMAGKRDPEYVTEQEKVKAWNALVKRAGTGVKGKLASKKRSTPVQSAPIVAPVVKAAIAPDDVDSTNILAYLLGK